jgi:hypothetical protein
MLSASGDGYKIQTESSQVDDGENTIVNEPTPSLTVLEANNSSNEVIKKLTDLDVGRNTSKIMHITY